MLHELSWSRSLGFTSLALSCRRAPSSDSFFSFLLLHSGRSLGCHAPLPLAGRSFPLFGFHPRRLCSCGACAVPHLAGPCRWPVDISAMEAIVAAFGCKTSPPSLTSPVQPPTSMIDAMPDSASKPDRVPVTFCLTATVLFESHLASPGCPRRLPWLKSVPSSVKRSCWATAAFPPSATAAASLRFLLLLRKRLSKLCSLLLACPCVQNNSLPLPCFARLWLALQAQFDAAADTPPFCLTSDFRRQSCAVPPTRALDAALALAPLQQCLAPEK